MRILSINPLYIYNKNNQPKTQIKFGESEDFEPIYTYSNARKKETREAKWLARKAEIEDYYNKQLDSLASLADEVGMDNNYFWNQANKIREEKSQKLREAKDFYS